MLGLDYAEQLKQKEAAVRKLVGKYGPVAPIRGAENPCHYRNKVISTFAAGPGGKLVSSTSSCSRQLSTGSTLCVPAA